MNGINITIEDVVNPLGNEIGQLKILLAVEQAKVKALQTELSQVREEAAL